MIEIQKQLLIVLNKKHHLLDLSELVAVTQDEVHVFVKGFESPDEDTTVLQDAPHPEVDVLQHLTTLSNSL